MDATIQGKVSSRATDRNHEESTTEGSRSANLSILHTISARPMGDWLRCLETERRNLGKQMSGAHSKKVVVLHSGGLDSTVCLLLAQSRGHQVLSLGVNYNQRHQVELEYAARHCAQFDIERRVISVTWDKPLRTIPTNRSVREIRSSGVSPAFLPGRNGIFLMLAAAEAAGVGADEVWTGVNSVDFSGYPDCRPQFIASFQKMLSFAIPRGPRLVAPLQNKSKPQIARMAKRLGIGPTDTWSCYRPRISENGLSPCGACDACQLHALAWDSLA